MRLELFRHTANTEGDRNIIGDQLIDGKFFCYTLEDEKRADGVKIAGVTAIPAIEYKVKITYSPRFKRNLPIIYTHEKLVIDGKTYYYCIYHDGQLWQGVRYHGGNTSKDSHGCPLVAFNTDGKKIWATAEKSLVQKLQQATEEITLRIYDSFLSYVPNYQKN